MHSTSYINQCLSTSRQTSSLLGDSSENKEYELAIDFGLDTDFYKELRNFSFKNEGQPMNVGATSRSPLKILK